MKAAPYCVNIGQPSLAIVYSVRLSCLLCWICRLLSNRAEQLDVGVRTAMSGHPFLDIEVMLRDNGSSGPPHIAFYLFTVAARGFAPAMKEQLSAFHLVQGFGEVLEVSGRTILVLFFRSAVCSFRSAVCAAFRKSL